MKNIVVRIKNINGGKMKKETMQSYSSENINNLIRSLRKELKSSKSYRKAITMWNF